MKKLLFYYLFTCLALFNAGAQDGPYSLASIPEAVKNKAAVVTHLENIDYEAESTEKASLRVHKVYTVMNEDGKDALLFREYSSKFISLDDAEIKVFDAKGKQTGRYRKKDMVTVATGEGLIEDGYVTYYGISTSTYPVTVEVRYEKKLKTTLRIPSFRFVNIKEGVVESNYTVTIPADIPIRYKAEHTSIEPVINEKGNLRVYKWTVKNQPPVEYEEGSASSGNRYPHVKIVADRFSHYGYAGDLSTWKNFGAWIWNLYKGLDVLTPARQQFFSDMVKNAADEKEKIRRIYQYLQENFRYVSIQLGIGGLKPFSAEFTDSKKYGDCKALSNYMKAALSSVGIKSHVAIINAEYNDPPVDPGFPSNDDFNHVILCVPGTRDSIWLECTSSTAEFGELGTFTENRYALLVTEEGGVLVPTPKSRSGANILSTRTTVSMSEDLSGYTETIFTTKGEYRETLNSILKEKKDAQKEALVFYYGFKQPDEFELTKDNNDNHKARLKMVVSKVPEFTAGDKLFIAPRIHKAWSSKLPKTDNRKLDFYFRHPFERYDTTIFRLGPEMNLDILPTEKNISCSYASYHSKYWYNEPEKSIYSATTIQLKQHKIPSADYESVRKFFDDILAENTQKLVLKKTGTGEAQKKAF